MTSQIAPAYIVKVGRKVYPIASFEQASLMTTTARDKSGVGSSRFTNPLIFEGDRLVAHVSYNGRVWAGSPQEWQPTTVQLCEAQYAA